MENNRITVIVIVPVQLDGSLDGCGGEYQGRLDPRDHQVGGFGLVTVGCQFQKVGLWIIAEGLVGDFDFEGLGIIIKALARFACFQVQITHREQGVGYLKGLDMFFQGDFGDFLLHLRKGLDIFPGSG